MSYDGLTTYHCPKFVYQTRLVLRHVLKFVIKLEREKSCLKIVKGYSHMLRYRYNVLRYKQI
jgi:hypothetical protein